MQSSLADGPLTGDLTWPEHFQEEGIDGVVVGLDLAGEVGAYAEGVVVEFPR